VSREWRRLIAERAGLAPDSTAEEGAEYGLDVAAEAAPGRPIGFRGAGGGSPVPAEPAASPEPAGPPEPAAPVKARPKAGAA
jgi:hypothetical protein